MPNIWVYVVGGIVAIGAIVSIQGIIGENEGTKGTERQAATITGSLARPDAMAARALTCSV